MKNVTNKIEEKLGDLGSLIALYPLRFIIVIMMVVGSIASNLPNITVDTSTEGFLHETSQTRIAYNEFRDQFGRDERMVVAIKSDSLFSLDTLTKLRDMHNELATKVPHLFDITSLINARNTEGRGDSLLVDDLFQNWPETQAQADKLKQVAMANPLFENLILSKDGKFTVIILESNTYTDVTDKTDDKVGGFADSGLSELELELNDELGGFDEVVMAPGKVAKKRAFITDKENTQMVVAVTNIVERYRSDDFEIHIAGSPSVTAFLKQSLQQDMAKFVLMILGVTIVLLALLFRRASGVILPIVAVILAVVATMGLMALTATPIKVMTQVLPSFLLAVGVGASIHVLAIFFKHFDQHGDKPAAIRYTLEHSGLAIIMTSLTTAAGMASFVTSEVAPVADLGLFSAVGVIISLMFTLILLPASLMLFNIKRRPVDNDAEHHDRLDQILKVIANFSQDHAKKIVVVSLLFMTMAIIQGSKIGYSHNPLLWFPATHDTRIATEVIDKEMRGSISMEIVIDTGRENGLYNLALLQAIEGITNDLNAIEHDTYFVGKAMSVVDVIKEIHKGLNGNKPEFYALPSDEKLIPQEILLFENSGSEDLEDFVDSQFSKARITAKVPWIDSFEYNALLEETVLIIEKRLHNNMAIDADLRQGITVTTTGMIPLLAQTISSAITSSGVSYMIAFGIIAIMLMLLLSSVKLGLLSMIPNLFPVFFVLAIMVLFSFPLDLFTMLIGVIVIGIAVDDIVHFMHNFRRYHLQGMSTRKAVELTLTTTGRAMTITTIVLFFGFMLYMFASMSNLFLFGLLTATAFLVALMAVFLLAPALMALVYPDEDKHNPR